jgi:hypothetical protein
MATFDIFNNDAFSVSSLSAAIQDIPRVPTKIGDMGLFAESGMTTISTMIERQGAELSLVPTAPRGGVAQNTKTGPRKMVPVAAVHLPQKDTIMADQVQGVRAFGSETEVMGVMELINDKMTLHRRQIDLTLEYHRVGAIKGQVLDTDGSVLLDMYSVMGFTQETVPADILSASSTMDPIAFSQFVKRKIKTKLGGRSFKGVKVLASQDWFDKFTRHNNTKAAFKDFQGNVYLRTDQSEQDFEFAGISYTIYEGATSAGEFIPAGEAYAFPIGVPGLFQTKWAPGTAMDMVNRMGKPFYASQERLPHNIGVEIFSQSNPLNFCMLPEAVLKLTDDAS